MSPKRSPVHQGGTGHSGDHHGVDDLPLGFEPGEQLLEYWDVKSDDVMTADAVGFFKHLKILFCLRES